MEQLLEANLMVYFALVTVVKVSSFDLHQFSELNTFVRYCENVAIQVRNQGAQACNQGGCKILASPAKLCWT